jgi:hypothetical protein
MYKLEHTSKSIKIIKWFIHWYKYNFTKLFEDTWLFCEQEIIKEYIKIWDFFNDLIFKEINNLFIQDIILWRSKDQEWLFLTTLKINNFRLFITYEEDTKLKIRYIENIDFHRK